METGLKKQINDLNQCVQEFIKCIDLLPASLFLKKIDKWAPRDVLAHLIGWNYYTIKGCLQLMKGELPFYFIDANNDFRIINALSVKRYNSKDKQTLLTQLNNSLKELEKFIITAGTGEWEKNTVVRYGGGILNINNTINALMADYDLHRQQIKKWAEKEKNRQKQEVK